ncbi:CheR family methyltransferase [Candidatus Leptofilum sp.]|uniref:CheR family methyltransferase n=1 Tax=Candidatus Leptofilum sp. TaxID=3241576 RepID=UPI003B5A0F9E
MSETENTLEKLEIRLLLDGIYEHYGYDFRDYAPETLKRRIQNRVRNENLTSVSGLLEKALHDQDCFYRLVADLSITVSTMFRNPGLFVSFRNEIVPYLKTYPFIRIWHAGCGKGEEVYSMAILLYEEGLHERCRIYATDMNQDALKQARQGIFPLKQMQEYTRNYQAAGGQNSFSEYYAANYDNAIFHPWLRENILFSRHNLTIDGPFNEFNVILCRNVMIYFNRELQNRVHHLFYNSLATIGFLILGRSETIKFTPYETNYEAVGKHGNTYKKSR